MNHESRPNKSGPVLFVTEMKTEYILTLKFISEQKLRYSTIVYIKITCLNRIYNKFDNS